MTVDHCCEALQGAVDVRCERHPEPGECGDYVIGYSEKFDEYGLWIHDGGSSWITIQYCPFCGARMRPSQRDKWFDRLEQLGLEPEDAPPDMQGSRWWLGDGETARRR